MFFFSSRRRHTRCSRDWSSDVCSSDLAPGRARAEFLSTVRNVACFWSAAPFRLVLGRRVTSTAESESEEHTSELQSRLHLVCRLLLEKKKKKKQLYEDQIKKKDTTSSD